LAALGWFRSPELKEAALDYALKGSLRPQERAVIARTLTERPESQELAYRWMTKNYTTILSETTPLAALTMPAFAGGCSTERLEEARAFFHEPEHNRPGVERELAKVGDQVTDCAGLHDREGGSVAAFFKQMAAAR